MNKITRFYQDLVESIKEFGFTVRHYSKMPCGLAGQCRLAKKEIAIHKAYKNTLVGCFVLGHEAGHMVDFIDKKFKKFFYAPGGRIDDKKLIREVEWSATVFARKLLRERGFKTDNICGCDYKSFREELPDWYEMYSQKSWRYAAQDKKKRK